jgi:hypothetical protein
MRYSTFAAVVGLAALPVLSVPVLNERYSPYPLADGFPNPSASELLSIEAKAGGTLGNGPPPASLSAVSATNLRLIAFNEIFETAFFTDLLYNITTHQKGYTSFGAFSREFVVDALVGVINVRISDPKSKFPADILNSKSSSTHCPQMAL